MFPERRLPWGPRTLARVARTLGVYAAVAALGLGFILLGQSMAAQAFGLGLIAPGAGFLLWTNGETAAPHIALAALSFAAVLGGLALWFATGNVLPPFLIWLGAALYAAWMGENRSALCGPDQVWPPALWAVPASVFALLTLGLGALWLNGRAGLTVRLRKNARLARAAPPPPAREAKELSLDDLHLLRLLLDRALQPVERFEGFEFLDQFQTAAVRYQINFISYALSLAQRVHMPAFQGYLTAAQHNLIRKQMEPRVWRYWALENLWGNFDPSADPMARDNIMFTGFVAAQLAYFRAASGVREYDEAGSVTFAHPSGKRFAYDFSAMISALKRDYARAPLGLVACEPNWVYPLCNTIGATAIRAEGEAAWRAAEDHFRHHLESEFITPAGYFIPCRSAYFGFALPRIGGAVAQAMPCLFLNSTLPAIARRHWALLRGDLRADALRRMHWPIDTGNYRFSRAAAYAGVAATAVELGDHESADLVLAALEQECPRVTHDGVSHRPAASLWAHAVEMMARCGGTNALADLVAHPAEPPLGPHIAGAPYPHVLVARAYAQGEALHAVLHGAGSYEIALGGLKPARTHKVQGRSFLADARGEARVSAALDGRTEILVAPVE